MKEIVKKWWFWGIIIILILGIFVYALKHSNTELNSYKKQSIAVLTQYKDGKLTREETEEKIDAIVEKLGNEYKIKEETNIYLLESKLSLITQKLFNEELSNTLINQYIQAIKEID